MAQKVDELMKELSKYADELQKKHKSVKEDEASTIEAGIHSLDFKNTD